MTATCLDLIGAKGEIVVEAPFASNEPYLAMLQAATGRPVVANCGGTGTSIGAAMLAKLKGVKIRPSPAVQLSLDLRLKQYAWEWTGTLKNI